MRHFQLSALAWALLTVACGSPVAISDPIDGGGTSRDAAAGASKDASSETGLDASLTPGPDAAVVTKGDAGAAGLDASVVPPDAGGTPADHTLVLGGHDHKPGNTDPLKNCVACHGPALKGGKGPNCYSCHNTSDHTKSRKGVKHRPGTSVADPSCNPCHGPNNTGGLGPACSSCH